jgi:hypothetical protein
VIHKFAQKYKFKGSWDAAGNLVKQTIHRLEMNNVRVANAKDCFEKLGKELTKTGEEKDIKKMLEYKQTGDKKVVENTALRTRRTFVGVGTADTDEYDQLRQAGKKHVVFTDRGHVRDMKAVKGTQKLFQVQGAKKARPDGEYDLHTFKLPCSCDNCINNPHQVNNCFYLESRGWKKEVVKEKKATKYSNKKVSELHEELCHRHLPTSGLKTDLIMRLRQDDIENEGPRNEEEDNMIALTSAIDSDNNNDQE